MQAARRSHHAGRARATCMCLGSSARPGTSIVGPGGPMAVTLLDVLPWRIGPAVVRCLGPTEEDNRVIVNRGTDARKLVVLLGWGGARQRHLSRVRQFYLEQGFVVVSYISPMSRFVDGSLSESDIAELASSVGRESSQINSNSFYVHLHSNNGTFVWGALMLALQESTPHVLSELSGIIWDSAPRMELRPPGLVFQALGFTFPCIPIMLRKSQYAHPLWTPALFLYFLVKMMQARLRPVGKFGFAQLRDVVLHGMPGRAPQLYVYSSGDRLVTRADVEAYISLQRQRGMHISTKRFADTPHVQHFLRREAEYTSALKGFLGIA